ncbi:uncharacterized protein [Spinacia oleracea]|uniref:Uncharacterized protein isoform X1 n=1 Tax=Spinacia oleracea TaxID=3562 RepID=A0ABM3QT78_SPIOL|nr:uncharacterized protein LOC110799034 isoform X1 [Spinacia oleracea]XP_056686571.1 uncharacterized protein LOC110799034 isoform X1 [Spinacia oleracea]
MCCSSKECPATSNIKIDLEDCSCTGKNSSLSNNVDVVVDEAMEIDEVMEDDACSSNVQNSGLAESRYRFVNRRRADSFLSISKKDYRKLVAGKSISYVNSRFGSPMVIRIMPTPRNSSSKDVKVDAEGFNETPIPLMKECNQDDVDSSLMGGVEDSVEEIADNTSLSCLVDNHTCHALPSSPEYDSKSPSPIFQQGRRYAPTVMGKGKKSGLQEKSTALRRRLKAWKRGSRDQSHSVFDCRYRSRMKRKASAPALEFSDQPSKRVMSCISVQSCSRSCSASVESSSSSSLVHGVSCSTHDWAKAMCSG